MSVVLHLCLIIRLQSCDIQFIKFRRSRDEKINEYSKMANFKSSSSYAVTFDHFSEDITNYNTLNIFRGI